MTLRERLKRCYQELKREIKVYQLVIKDKRTPKLAKWMLGAAVAYAVSPIDLIPDFIPIIGHLDDIVIVPILFYLALKLIPKDIIDEKKLEIGGAL